MTDWDIYQDIPIPPRHAESFTLSFLRGIISASFTRDGHPLSPKAVKSPGLTPLAHSVRADGSLSVASAQAFLERYDSGRLPPETEVSIDPNLYRLTPQDPPRELTLTFVFDGTESLSPLVEAWGKVFYYDGHGVFLSAQGDYFSLEGVIMIDAFLDASRRIPATHFKLFFKLLLPRIALVFPTVCSLQLTEDKPVLFTPLTGNRIEAAWSVPYEDLTFFQSAPMLCEAYGKLMPSSVELASLSGVCQKDGEIRLNPTLFKELNRLYLALPGLFTEQPRFQVLPKSAPAAEISFDLSDAGEASFAVPPPKKPESVTLSLSGSPGLLCRKTKSRPLYMLRANQLSSFIRQYGAEPGPEVTPTPYSAFSPNHRDLNKAQRETYFYARACYLRKEALRVDYAYLLLLVYEACNLPNRLEFMLFLWESNRGRFARLDLLLPGIIRDYIVLHQPEIPLSSVLKRIGVKMQNLPYPETFLDLSSPAGLELLPFSYYSRLSGYEFEKSRFYTENKEALLHAFRTALLAADRYLREHKGKGFLTSGKSHRVSFSVDACAPAITTAENSFSLTYEFDSYLTEPSLSERVGNLFKLTENQLRSKASFRGRLKVSPLEPELEKAVLEGLNPRKAPAPISLDISRALSIEEESWDTTERLIAESGIEEDLPPVTETPPAAEAFPAEEAAPAEDTSLYEALVGALNSDELDYLLLLFRSVPENELSAFCREKSLLPDTLEETINEKSLELTGDILIENRTILEDYREELSFLADIRKEF